MGICRLRKDFRMFKLNRMDAITLTEKEVEKRDVTMPDLSTERIFPESLQVSIHAIKQIGDTEIIGD